MNELIDADQKTVAVARVLARAEAIRNGDLWMTGIVHALSLLALFVAILIASDAAEKVWPWLSIAKGPFVDLARIGLLATAAVVLISVRRRASLIGRIELELLRADIEEIQQRASHS
jgi:acyl dehydratase